MRPRTIALCLLASVFTTAACGAADQEKAPRPTGPVEVGDPGPGGGVIVYVDPVGFDCGKDLEETCTYLEVSPAAAQAERQWSLDVEGRVGVGADPGTQTVHHAIGAGEYNSEIIARYPGAGDAATNAAIYALEYATPTADDWYLPSIDELKRVYEQRALVDGVRMDSYWSSTEGTAIDAWGVYFAEGRVSTNFKWRVKTYYAHPMRAG